MHTLHLYSRRGTGRESLVFILILALIAIWLYRNSGMGVFGRQMGVEIPAPGTAPSVGVNTAPVTSPVVTVEEPSIVSVEQRPVITADQQSDILGYSRVAVDSLNLRAHPGFQHKIISVLPGNWEVAILRQLHVTPNGEEWVEVLAETNQGWRKGWVIKRYLDFCNCPTY